MQPDVTSRTVAPDADNCFASRLVSPKSFSIINIRSFVLRQFNICCKYVVFPAPKNPDMIVIGIIIRLPCKCKHSILLLHNI